MEPTVLRNPEALIFTKNNLLLLCHFHNLLKII